MNTCYPRLIMLGLVLCLSGAQVPAQDSPSGIDCEPIVIRRGISFFRINDINCLAAEGDLVWIGTPRGLYSYNINTRKADTHSMRRVSQIEVVNGDVWTIESAVRRLESAVETPDVIRHFDSRQASWTTITTPKGVSGRLRHFSLDGTDLWVGTTRTPQASPGMFLYHLDIRNGKWTTHVNDGLKRRQIDGKAYPVQDCANIIHVGDDHLVIFGQCGTYRFNKGTRDWHEIRTSKERQAAVVSAFSPSASPIRQQVGFHCTNSIDSQSSLWFSSLGLPESYERRVLAFVIKDPVVWLGTTTGLQRFDRSDKAIRQITTSDVTITDLDMSTDAVWVSVQQKGLLRLVAERNWADFVPITVAEISDPPEAVIVEGLVRTGEESLPQKGVCIVPNWQSRKRSYYFVVGKNVEIIRQHAGKIVKVSGEAVLVRGFGWGGAQYQLDVNELLDVRQNPP